MIRRTDEFKRRLDDEGAQWSDSGRALHYGDPRAEARAARSGGAMIYDASARETLVIQGRDTISWFQSLFTNDVLDLEDEGSGQRTHAVNRLGRTISDARVLHMPELLMLDLEAGALHECGLKKHLNAHIVMESVQLLDRTAQTGRVELIGRAAVDLLAKIADVERAPDSLAMYHGTWGALDDIEIIAQRLPLGQTPRVSLSCDRERLDRLWDTLRAAMYLAPIGELAMDTLHVESGEPRFMLDYDTSFIPIEADLNDTICYDKGCYLGQEIIHRLDTQGTPAKLLRALVPHDEASSQRLAAGQAIMWEGKQVGEISRVVASSGSALMLCVAALKRGAYDLGATVQVKTDQGEVEATVMAFGSLVP